MNVSEGRSRPLLDQLTAAVDPADLLDLHVDPHHNRAVLTLVGEAAPRALAHTAVGLLDLRGHAGVHPRIGVVDVVPFVPLGDEAPELTEAIAARDRFADWISRELDVPAFLYGPERSLPDLRREAFKGLAPDYGPPSPHPSAGAVAVGARRPLVAWNVYMAEPDLAQARAIATAIRGPHVRALGLQVGERVQVSLNLIAPTIVGPAEAWDLIASHAPPAQAELVGLVSETVLARIPRVRWEQLDLSATRTFESRLAKKP